jgi:broad specificity phosphatase PhoE
MPRFFALAVFAFQISFAARAFSQQLLVIRHGQALQNVLRIVNSDFENSKKYPLTEKGIMQVHETSEALKIKLGLRDHKIAAVYVSPLLRTLQTARILLSDIGITDKKMRVEPLIRENRMGKLEERTEEEYLRFVGPNWDHSSAKDYGGETDEELTLRLKQFLAQVANAKLKGWVIIVTHGSPAKALIRMLDPVQAHVPEPGHAEYRILNLPQFAALSLPSSPSSTFSLK